MLTFIAFIFVFGILVFVHELGHFLMARKLGVRVEEFGFGFPPKIWSKEKKGTRYSINLIPLGGFVKLYGENGEGAGEKDSYISKKKYEKILILLSGVFMNFMLTVLLLSVLYSIGFKGFIPGMEKHKGVKNTQKIEILEVEKGTPAALVLKEGDIVKAIEGEQIYLDTELFQKINDITKNNPEKEIKLTIQRDGVEEDKILKTYSTEVESRGKKVPVRRIGVILETKGELKAPVYIAPVAAFGESFRLAKFTFFGILDFFTKIITRFTISEGVVGPAGIVSMVGGAAKAGFVPLLQFMSILSLSLAVINILPIPALDGGHIFIILIEKIKGKDLSHDSKNIVQLIGFVSLILLMVLVTIRDITGISALDYLRRIF